MNSSKYLNETKMLILDKQHFQVQCPKLWARYVPFMKQFLAVLVYKLGRSLAFY